MYGKKICAVVLCAAMLLSGCSGKQKSNEKTSFNESMSDKQTQNVSETNGKESKSKDNKELADIIPKKTVTLDVYSQLSGYKGMQKGWFAKEMLDRFNVKLNFINDGSDGFYSKQEATGDLGDIVIWGSDADQYHSAIKKGLLLDWEKNGVLDKYGSDMKKNISKALKKNKKNSGGHIYGFGYDIAMEGGEFGDFDYHPDIRWDLYEKIGKPEVSSLDDYVDILKKMKEILVIKL